MDLLQGELEHFIMNDDETMTQMYERFMVLVLDIATLGSTEWDDHKVTKKLHRAFTPRNPTFATMIRRDTKSRQSHQINFSVRFFIKNWLREMWQSLLATR